MKKVYYCFLPLLMSIFVCVTSNSFGYQYGYEGATFSGAWSCNSGISGAYADEECTIAAGTGSNTATFRPNIEEAGNYRVYTWWSAGSDRATNAPYTIYYSGGGSMTINVDQRINGSQWNLLGTYPFSQGTSGSIVLSDDANNKVVADAIRFVCESCVGTQNIILDTGIRNIGMDTDIQTQPGPLPTGYRAAGPYYEITCSGCTSPITVTVPYTCVSGVWPIPHGKLFHWIGSSWEDVTISVDTANNSIKGRVTSLSPFVCGYPFSGSGDDNSYPGGKRYSTGANENMITLIIILAITGGILILRKNWWFRKT